MIEVGVVAFLFIMVCVLCLTVAECIWGEEE
jgi:hypothetical protein